MRKSIITLALALLAIVGLIGGTYAVFTTETKTTSVITASNLDVELIALDADGNVVSDALNMTPGTTKSIEPKVKNISNEDAWLRIGIKVNDDLVDEELMEYVELNDTDYTLQDGYLYLNNPLLKGETSPVAFKGVKLSESVGNEMSGEELNFKIVAEAVQVKHNGSSVLEAKGWPNN